MAPWFEESANYRVLPVPNIDLRYQRYDLPYLSAKMELRRGLGGNNGLVFDALIDGKLRVGPTVFLSAGPPLSVTDGTHNQAYFGVNASQSANTGYAQYYPGAGLRSVGAAAGNSPTVTGAGGSRNQFVGGSAVSWRFEF